MPCCWLLADIAIESGDDNWRQVLLTLLEAAMKQPKADLHGLALSALENEELPVGLVDDVVTTVERVITSEVWQRARKADRCLPEVPLAMPVSAAESGNGLPTVLRGVIDLVFLESAGWVIVDYKSERVEAGDIPALVAYYKPEIEAYAKAWEKVIGQSIVERGLFFTHTGMFVTV